MNSHISRDKYANCGLNLNFNMQISNYVYILHNAKHITTYEIHL